MTELARFTAHGHPALRASHAKTLEFTAEVDVTPRATCVLGVAASLPPRPVAGPIRIILSLASDPDLEVTVDAIGNSAWQPGGSAVIRRSAVRRPDTFATDADLAAADLPRSFAARLTDPSVVLSVVVSRRPTEPSLVRFRLHPTADSRLRAEVDAADQVLAEDAGARAWLAAAGVELGGEPDGRVLSVSAAPAGRRPEGPVSELIGWPVEVAVLAARSQDGPSMIALDAGPAAIALLAAANPAAAIVFRAAADEVAKVLEQLGRPAASLVVVSVTDPERPMTGTVSAPELPERGEVIGLVEGTGGSVTATPVEPASFVASLLSQGVTPRTVALALTELPGWSRRAAYDFVLSVQG